MDRRRIIMTLRGGWKTATLSNIPQWNQLTNSSVFPSTTTVNGFLFTNNGDGSFTVSRTGSSTVNASLYAYTSKQLDYSHKYLIQGCPSGGSIASSGYWVNLASGVNDSGVGIIISNKSSIDYRMTVGGEYQGSDLVFRPQAIDLTIIYGAGNEPTTTAEFQATFPNAYYAYKLATANTDGSQKYEYQLLDAIQELYQYREEKL